MLINCYFGEKLQLWPNLITLLQLSILKVITHSLRKDSFIGISYINKVDKISISNSCHLQTNVIKIKHKNLIICLLQAIQHIYQSMLQDKVNRKNSKLKKNKSKWIQTKTKQLSKLYPKTLLNWIDSAILSGQFKFNVN